MHLLKDLLELRRSLRDLVDAGDELDRKASHELTASARRFTRHATRVVDDKLSFSATLMRAGEVEAAHRLLAEVEHDVRTEEAALLEQVNEVKTVHTIQRERITRLRLARTLAVAMLGASSLAFSAMGIAVAGFIADRNDEGATTRTAAPQVRVRDARASDNSKGLSERLRKVRIGGRDMILTEGQLLVYRQLATGSVSASDAAQLLSLLPPDLAARVRRLVVAVEAARNAAPNAEEIILRAEAKAKKKKAAAEEKKEEAKASPQPSPSPSGQGGQPSPTPTPTQGPLPDEDRDNEEEDDGPLNLPQP